MSLITAYEVINGGILRPAPMDVRFDATLISPHIEDAEERFVVPVLCRDFYDALITAKGNNISNYNTAVGAIQQAFPGNNDYETLWTKHLMSYCAMSVLYEAYPFIAIQLGSNGLYLNETEFGNNAGIKGVKFMQDTLLQRIESKKDRLEKYLCENKDTLTEFCADNCTDCETETTDTPTKDLGIIFY